MTSFPGSPRLLKGALIGFDLFNPLTSVIQFQYNPHTLTRTIKPRGMSEEGAAAEAQRLTGPPEETIQAEVEIDATDLLEKVEPTAVASGIAPQLAALEALVYPSSWVTIANTVLLATGTIEIIPPEAPLTIFIWGMQRILPVRLTEFTITEEAFDARLNPIRAKVNLSMRVLSTNDLPLTHPGYYLFLAHQIAKEVLAVRGSVNNLTAVAGVKLKIM
jgi:hypothetical protein